MKPTLDAPSTVASLKRFDERQHRPASAVRRERPSGPRGGDTHDSFALAYTGG